VDLVVRPVILHGFGASAKKRLPSRLAELAHHGWMPMVAALFGTAEWTQWMHQNFLPVIGPRLHAKLPPSPVTYKQLVLLLGMWERPKRPEAKTVAPSHRRLTSSLDSLPLSAHQIPDSHADVQPNCSA